MGQNLQGIGSKRTRFNRRRESQGNTRWIQRHKVHYAGSLTFTAFSSVSMSPLCLSLIWLKTRSKVCKTYSEKIDYPMLKPIINLSSPVRERKCRLTTLQMKTGD